MRVLIIYYSLSGNTKFIAESLAEAIGADVLELQTAKQIEGGNFMKHFWGGKQVVHKEKPELLQYSKDIADYDCLIIGTPVWAFTFTPAVRSFLSKEKIHGKKVALFCCCDGMAGKTIENLKKEISGNDFIGDLVLERTAKNREVNKQKALDWVKTII